MFFKALTKNIPKEDILIIRFYFLAVSKMHNFVQLGRLIKEYSNMDLHPFFPDIWTWL